MAAEEEYAELFANAPMPPPKGWEPYSEYTGAIGNAIVRLPRPDATRTDLLVEAGFNPDEWAVVGNVNVRKWMRYDQEWLYYFKFDVQAGVETEEHFETDVDELVDWLHTRKRSLPSDRGQGGGDAFAFVASDWQIGKREGSIGTEQTVQRVADAIDQAVIRVKQLRKIGRRMETGAFLGTGDLVEGTCGFYPNQPFLIDTNRRNQNRLTRQLITYGIDELAPLFERFVAVSVAGNHGENREDGRKVTDDGDNEDVAVFEGVREAIDRSGRPGNVEWIIPDDELSLLVELGGVPVGLTHGHLFSRGGSLSQAKALEWWKGQIFGLRAVAKAKVLISSHFHHYSVLDHGGRVHIQTPAADPGSKWFRDVTGLDAPAGVLTLRFDSTHPLGFDDASIL